MNGIFDTKKTLYFVSVVSKWDDIVHMNLTEWLWDAVQHFLSFCLQVCIQHVCSWMGVCYKKQLMDFERPWGISGLTGRWKMIHSPNHIYLSNTICVLSHTHVHTRTHTRVCLSREPQGQRVWGVIERPHGATATFNVQVFIRVRSKIWLCYC